VKDFYTSCSNVKWYADRQAAKQHALSGAEVDEMIATQEQNLLNTVGLTADYEVEVIQPATPVKKSSRSKTKAAKANPLDKVLEDLIGKE
jgi:hypothetical protein